MEIMIIFDTSVVADDAMVRKPLILSHSPL